MRHRFAASLCAAAVTMLAVFAGTSLAGNGNGNGNGNGSASKQSSTSASNPATRGSNTQGVKPSNSTKHNSYATASSNQTKQYGNGKTAGEIATQAGQPDATLHGPGNSQPHKTNCGGHEVDVHALKNKGARCGVVTSTQSTGTSGTGAVSQGSSTYSHTHVTICHATGSASHPYVMISPSASGVFHGHLGHSGDIIPPFTYNGQTYSLNWDTAHQAIYQNGCNVAVTTSVSAAATQAALLGPQAAVLAAQSQAATQTPTAVGGVKSATFTLKQKTTKTASAAIAKPKPAGGVLGATTRLGHAITTGTLPFTGLRLWIIALVAAGLLLIGLVVRRTTANGRI